MVAFVLVVAGVAFAVGFAVRSWWVLPALVPIWAIWTGVAGTDNDQSGPEVAFVVGFLYVLAPALIAAAAGVWLGRRGRAGID